MATMETSRKSLTCPETAKLVRKALKKAFPSLKFSVRSNSYAGGASIYVRWTDGPTVKQVDAVTERFKGATFNAMEDMKEYREDTLLANEDGTYEQVSYGADYISAHREYSEEIEAEAKAQIAKLAGVAEFEHNGRYDVAADRDTGELFACRGQHVSDTYGSTILHRHLYQREL